MILHEIKDLYRVPAGIISLILIAFMGVSSIYSVSPITTAIEAMKFFVIILLFAISFIYVYTHKLEVKDILSALALGAVIPVVFGLFQLILGTGINTFDVTERIFGTFAHPNVFAFFVTSLFFIHVHAAYIEKYTFADDKDRFYAHATSVTLLALLFATFTRGAWVGCAIFLLILGILKFRKLLAFSVLGLLSLYILFPVTNSVYHYYTNSDLRRIQLVERLTTRDEDADSISWRTRVVTDALPIIKTRPLYGFGYGTFPEVWEQSRGAEYFWDDSAESHNDFLRFAVELGFTGVVLYTILLASLFFGALFLYFKSSSEKKQPTGLHLFAWIAAFGIMSLGDNMLHHTPVMWMTWVWWGAMFGVLYRERHEYFNFLKNS